MYVKPLNITQLLGGGIGRRFIVVRYIPTAQEVNEMYYVRCKSLPEQLTLWIKLKGDKKYKAFTQNQCSGIPFFQERIKNIKPSHKTSVQAFRFSRKDFKKWDEIAFKVNAISITK